MRIWIASWLLIASACQSYVFPALSERHPASPAAPESAEPALPSALRDTPAPPVAKEPSRGAHHAH